MGIAVARAPERLSRGTWLALVAMGLGVFVIANDFTALSVAIPKIERDLHTSLSLAQWVINGYALVFGVLIVTGGRLADLLGRKRVFALVLSGATLSAGISVAFRVDAGLAVTGFIVLSLVRPRPAPLPGPPCHPHPPPRPRLTDDLSANLGIRPGQRGFPRA